MKIHLNTKILTLVSLFLFTITLVANSMARPTYAWIPYLSLDCEGVTVYTTNKEPFGYTVTVYVRMNENDNWTPVGSVDSVSGEKVNQTFGYPAGWEFYNTKVYTYADASSDHKTVSYSAKKTLTCVEPTPTPTPTATPSPTPTPTVEVTPTPTPTVEVTPTPTPTVEVTPTPTPTTEVTPTPTVTEEITPSPTEAVLAEVTELPQTSNGYAVLGMIAGLTTAGGAALNEFLKRI